MHFDVISCPGFTGDLNRIMSAKSLTNADLAAAQRIVLKNILSITRNPLGNTLLLRLRPDSSRTKFFVLGVENGEDFRQLAERCEMSGFTRRRASLAEFSKSQNSNLMLMLAALAGMLIWFLSGWEEEAVIKKQQLLPWLAEKRGEKKLAALLLGALGKAAIVLCSVVL